VPISTPTRSPAIGGESAFTYLHTLWVILCYYSLGGSTRPAAAGLFARALNICHAPVQGTYKMRAEVRKCESRHVSTAKVEKAEASAEVCVKCESYVSNTWRFQRIQAHAPIVNRPSSIAS